jgi:hypothetical protein
LEDECKIKDLGIVFQYEGPRTPQRNGKVESENEDLSEYLIVSNNKG